MQLLPVCHSDWPTCLLDSSRVDGDRIKEIGPEKAAAEWLIRNGAAIRWKNQAKFVSDYNSMEVTTRPGDTIEGIYR